MYIIYTEEKKKISVENIRESDVAIHNNLSCVFKYIYMNGTYK